jgi:cell division protein FtsB
VAKRQTTLPPYMYDSAVPELEDYSLQQPVEPKAKPKSKALQERRASKKSSKMVTLLLNEINANEANSVQAWPDEATHPLPKKPKLKRATLQVVRLGVGTGLLAVIGVQQLIQGWMRSEIWVKNAFKALGLTLLAVQLLVSCVAMVTQVFQVNAEVPVLERVYETHKSNSTSLKSQIHRLHTGEDAELLARDYLDMAAKDEILIKIQTP